MTKREFTITVPCRRTPTSEQVLLSVPAYVTDTPGLVLTPLIRERGRGEFGPLNDTFRKDGFCNITHHRSGRKVAGPFYSFEAARSFAAKLLSVRWDVDAEDMERDEAKALLHRVEIAADREEKDAPCT